MPVISAAAATDSIPPASASATCGCRAGNRSPVKLTRSAVASPTLTSRAASPVEPPVAAAINPTGEANPSPAARPSGPSSFRERRASSAAHRDWNALPQRASRPRASITRTSPSPLNIATGTSAPAAASPAAASPSDSQPAGRPPAHASRTAATAVSRVSNGLFIPPSCRHPPTFPRLSLRMWITQLARRRWAIPNPSSNNDVWNAAR